jgi:hypothetical protein
MYDCTDVPIPSFILHHDVRTGTLNSSSRIHFKERTAKEHGTSHLCTDYFTRLPDEL